MYRKAVPVILVALFCLTGIYGVSCAADDKKPITIKPGVPKAPAMPPRPSNVTMFGGTIEKIDTTDPANIKMQVRDETGGISRTISVAPSTNITKVTDASELKTGDAVRVMVRKIEDKDVAMGILFGKIKNLPPLRSRPVPPPAPKTPDKPSAKEALKK